MLAAFAREVVADQDTCLLLSRMQNIKALSLELNPFDEVSVQDGRVSVVERTISPEELEDHGLRYLFNDVNGVTSFTITASSSGDYEVLSEEEQSTFQINVKTLERQVAPVVTASKATDLTPYIYPACEDFTPLYAGSRVGLDTSAVRRCPSRPNIVDAFKTAAILLMSTPDMPTIVESTVIEMLETVLGDKFMAMVDGSDDAEFERILSPRTQAEEKLRLTQLELQKKEELIRVLQEGMEILAVIVVGNVILRECWKM